MTSTSEWYQQQAKANPDLFRVIFDFNLRPQFWVHPEVVEAVPSAPVVEALVGSSHGTSHLAQWLDQQLELDAHDPVWDFEEPRRRLNLLSHDTLRKLACYAGSAMHWPRIAATIGKVPTQEIKSMLGEGAHSFALRRARFLVPENDTASPAEGAPLSVSALDRGWEMLAAAASDEAAAISLRFALKLPPAVASKVDRVSDPEARDRAWSLFRRIATEVLNEGEARCFA